jgi:hypothetical protein
MTLEQGHKQIWVKIRRAGKMGFSRCSETCRIPNPTLKLNLAGEVLREGGITGTD